ncbi:MAG TPA: PKD domain-containing protein [Chitinophagales bacterium]|nr:PKD domain-containing protein [Chitinophagales bacterium]HNE45161.1 PKD domain-containing protein [Chitinophagales bacterium]HNI54723.1 PKD domain-containing protein [Chitinophagales bacterium]HNJ88939.1 PKD domain-containing protein [Chitinophagales bacterium]HNK98681.1 PKD domain-containing protein [Chitinophagales bacterium]
MKKLLFTLLVSLGCIGAANAQLPTATLTGEISGITRNLVNDTVYILNGFVYVEDGATLNIEAGTIIRGDKDTKGSLIVTKGSKIYANGTADQPIVFTSNQPEGTRNYGDWGGLIILGNAPINVPGGTAVIEGGVDTPEGDGVYGGLDPLDNSGIIKYVRIEYPGIAFVPGNEINGLTCGGVGAGTVIDHVMVSRSGDDAFEFFGGTVTAKYLIAHNALDDDLDTDFGFQGKIQFAVVKRDPNFADVSGSNGFESDNDATGSTNAPQTNPTFSNITVVGPIQNAGDVINVNYKRGAHLRRNTSTDIFNSVIIGYPSGIMIDGALCEASATDNNLKVQNTIIAGHNNDFEVAAGSTFDANAWFTTAAYNNTIYDLSSDVMLTDAYNATSPNFLPMAGSPLLSGSSFAAPELAGFTNTTYRGAFGDLDWTSCWANWDPQNTNYGEVAGTIAPAIASFSYANSDLTVSFSNTSSNAVSYIWDFGDETTTDDVSTEANPSYTYPALGVYTVTLTATGTCADQNTTTNNLDLSVAITDASALQSIMLYPNPASDVATLVINATEDMQGVVTILDMAGNMVMPAAEQHILSGKTTIQLATADLASGMYMVNILAQGAQQTLPLLIAK